MTADDPYGRLDDDDYDGVCGRVPSPLAVVVRIFPLPTPSAWAFLLCCAAGTRAITSASRTVWAAFIDWKA